MNESGDLSGSDELDEFEQSVDEAKAKNQKNATSYQNKPYDEAYEVSQDLSMAESFDGRDKVRVPNLIVTNSVSLIESSSP
jgi:hypothetical protein